MESSTKHIRLFAIFDRNRDGYIDVQDLKKLLRYYGHRHVYTKDIKDMIQEINSTCCIDKSKLKENTINFETFTVFCYDTDPTTFVQSRATVIEMMQLKSTGSTSSSSSLDYQEHLISQYERKKKKLSPQTPSPRGKKNIRSPQSLQINAKGVRNRGSPNSPQRKRHTPSSTTSPSSKPTTIYYRSTITPKKKRSTRNSSSRQTKTLNRHQPKKSPIIQKHIAKISKWLGKEQHANNQNKEQPQKIHSSKNYGLGSASPTDIEKTARKKRMEMQEHMNDAFKAFDYDKDGSISRSDLKHMMEVMGIHITYDEISALFGMVEARDRLTYDDFILLAARVTYME
mmetsp:Transcript_228/g.408  ORF Transcript_228/g.408 Transcript_228/m.408 type:complete len:342 (+) Transcript_228:38-1063(+)